VLHTSTTAKGPAGARIVGTRGYIEIPQQFFTPTDFRVVRDDGTSWTFTSPAGEGKAYEAAEVARCLAAGQAESPRMPWEHTLEVMGILDDARAQLGVTYPGE